MPYNNPYADSFSGTVATGGYGGFGNPKQQNPWQDDNSYKSVYNNADLYGQNQGQAGYGAFRDAYGGNVNFQNWLGKQESRKYQSYTGQAAQNPSLQWVDYLKNWDAANEYNSQSPYDRGIQPGQAYSPFIKFSPAQ